MLSNTDLANGKRRWMIPLLALAVFAAGSLPAEAQNTNISGVVKNQAGEPVAGALVKVRSESLGLGFMVVSQAQGQYSTPSLLPGEYTVQGFGGTSQSGSGGPVQVAAGRPGKMDLVLNSPLELHPREKQMRDADYEKIMPEGGVGKAYVAGKCTDCHSLQWTVAARKTREKWIETSNRMYDDLLGRRQPLWFAIKDGEPAQGQASPDRTRGLGTVGGPLIDYLAKNFGPENPVDPRALPAAHPNRNLPSTLLRGAEAKYLAMEFSVPSGSGPHDVAVDSQGIAWVSESNTGMLGRFDPNSLTYTRIAVPAGKIPKTQLNSIAVDPQDQVWFVDDGPNACILQYNQKSKEFNSYAIPDYPFLVPPSGGARIATLRFSNGNVWATGSTSNRIYKLDPATRKVTIYPIPRGAVPYGLAIGGDNAVWYAAEVGNVFVKLEPATGKLTPTDILTPRSDLRGLAADREGNLWAGGMESGKLVKLDPGAAKVTEYAPPSADAGVFSVDVDAKRNLIWFSEIFADKIARFDPASNTFVEYPHPLADSDVRRIEIDRSHPNRVWWSSGSADKIGYIDVLE